MWVRAVAVLLFLKILWTLPGVVGSVSCLLNATCLLPCSFNPGKQVLIHWHQLTGGSEHVVHSYYDNKDQLDLQVPRFRDRTSLFKDVIDTGNASLQLMRSQISDQGTFRCYASTTTGGPGESYIQLSVKAPVKEVYLRQEGNKITCRSEGLYPKPQLVWSNVTVQDEPVVDETLQNLYNIHSSVTQDEHSIDLPHVSCSVTAGSSSWRTMLFRTTFENVSNGEISLNCSTLHNKPLTDLDLVWTFNHIQTILTQRGADRNISELWQHQVEDGSESGVLKLKDLSSEHHQGVYTCHARGTEETFISNTDLSINEPSSNRLRVGLILTALGLTALVVGCLLWRYKKEGTTTRKKSKKLPSSDTNVEQTETLGTEEGLQQERTNDKDKNKESTKSDLY